MSWGALFLYYAHCFLTSGFILNSRIDRKSNDFGLHKVSNHKKFEGILCEINPSKIADSNDFATNFKGNEEESYESTNEDSEDDYVMDGFYYYGDDEYSDNGDEGANKADKSSESD
jgi:hypothetical protein